MPKSAEKSKSSIFEPLNSLKIRHLHPQFNIISPKSSMVEQSGCGVVLPALKVCTTIQKKCKKVYFFCDLFCRLKKKAYLCVNNKGKGLHPSSDPKTIKGYESDSKKHSGSK